MSRRAMAFAILCFALLGSSAFSQQPAASTPRTQPGEYQNTSEGLRSLIDEILETAKAKNTTREEELVHTLLVPEDSTWFVDTYGPGFGASLAAAYQRLRPSLEKEIKTVYEGNVQRGWTGPKILRYTDPESVNAPVDHFLNSMNQIVPLYTTAFQGNGPSFFMSLKPGDNGRQGAGDLDGYFIYDRGGFRFIPMEILMKLPTERPVRIHLDMNVMQSKLITKVAVRIPEEAIKKHISGRVVVELIIDVGGNIKESKVLEGTPILSAAVMEAVKQWRFASTTLDGDPVEIDLQVPFTFELH